MELFQAEIDAGLSSLLQNRTVAWHCPVRPVEPLLDCPSTPRQLPNHAVATNLNQHDLLYLDSVLVTAGLAMDQQRKMPFGWNNNDDIFDPLEVWAARTTPEDKPFNYAHDCADIIGHITSCHAEDLSGEIIAPDSVQVPDPFNIVTGAVLYRVWSKDELQTRMDEIADGLPRGDYFVSMECLFASFDYALTDRKGVQIIQRNAQTAHLSSHLRIAKGSGVYEGKRIGRVLRHLAFSGKGLVKNPANPKSVIRSTAELLTEAILNQSHQTGAKNATETEKNTSPAIAGYQTPTQILEKAMTETELKAKIAELQAALAAKDTAELERTLAATKAALEKVQAEKADLEKSLNATRDQVKTEVEKVVAQKAAAEQQLAAVQEQVAKLTEEKVITTRISQVIAALKWDEDKARKSVDALKGLPDAAFAAHLDVLATAMNAGVTTNNPQSGNTSFPSSLNVTTNQPVTGLPVPTPVTGLGNSQKPAVAATDTGILDRAQSQTEPALAAVDAENKTLTQDILSYLGFEPTQKS